MSPPLFRPDALERSAQPEGVGERIQVVRSRDALALAVLAALVLGALAWSIFGTVRVTVVGQGILLRSGAVQALARPPGGAELPPGSAQVLSTLDPPALVQRVSQLRGELRHVTETTQRTEELRDQGFQRSRDAIARQEAQITERIATLEALATEQVGAAARTRAERAADLKTQQSAARDVLARRDQQLTNAMRGVKEGVVSENQVTEAYAARLEAAASLDALNAAASQLKNDEVAARLQQDEIQERLETLRAQREQLHVEAVRIDREQVAANGEERKELAVLQRELDQAELELSLRHVDAPEEPAEARTFVSSPEPGVGGARPNELLVVLFMDAAQAKRVEQGAELRVSPDSVEVERFGAAVGRVVEVTTYPVTPAQAEVLLGNDALAQELARSGRAVVLIGRLEAADTPSGVRWTSSTGPSLSLSPGTTLTAHVTVERRRPIGFLLPFLRRMTGTDDT